MVFWCHMVPISPFFIRVQLHIFKIIYSTKNSFPGFSFSPIIFISISDLPQRFPLSLSIKQFKPVGQFGRECLHHFCKNQDVCPSCLTYLSCLCKYDSLKVSQLNLVTINTHYHYQVTEEERKIDRSIIRWILLLKLKWFKCLNI